MTDAIAVLNAGSSSLKFSLYANEKDGLVPIARGEAEGLLTSPRFRAVDAAGAVIDSKSWGDAERLDHEAALDYLLGLIDRRFGDRRLVAVGHRVVHGGAQYVAPVRVDAAVLASLEHLVPLAPLHEPHNLAPIRQLLARSPHTPQIACFDTAFHHNQPALARTFALPRAYTDRGIVRYGFHGLSYEYIAQALPRIEARAAAGRTVVLHLGNGASMCALAGGRSIATTMGFTALDGLPMGTRSGAIDPGVVLYCLTTLGMSTAEVEHLLYRESGLLGVSGVSSDMRVLEASNDPHAREAIDLFAYRIGRELGSLVAALGGLDAIVFTAGIGEHSAGLRERVCRAAAWLGVEFDLAANAAHATRISTAASRVTVLVVPTNEELMIARHTRDLLASDGRASNMV